MRCREAKHRLAKYESVSPGSIDDRELREHLETCPGCARDAAAARFLRRLLEAAAHDDDAGIMPITMQQSRVKARAADRPARGIIPVMAACAHALKKFPRPAYTVVLTVVVLALLTLVPFRYNRTVGYEIAFDGVDKELADNVEQICDMLFTLGLDNANVDVLGCDTTCSLLIVDLKSPEEVQRVITEFHRINPATLTSNVIPVQTSATGTLLDRANETLLRRQHENN